VPDTRYDALCALWKPLSEYPAYLSVTDIAGLVKGAAEGAGLGNAFLSHIQGVDALMHVVRAFESDEIVHVDDSVDPVRDLETIQAELCQKDLAYVESQEALALRDVKKTPDMKLPIRFFDVMKKTKELLTARKPVRDAEWTSPEIECIREKLPQLITTKANIFLVNLSASDFVRKRNKHLAGIAAWVAAHGGGPIIPISVEWEQKLWALREDAPGKAAFLAEAAGAKSSLPRAIVTGYRELELAHYFTVRCTAAGEACRSPRQAWHLRWQPLCGAASFVSVVLVLSVVPLRWCEQLSFLCECCCRPARRRCAAGRCRREPRRLTLPGVSTLTSSRTSSPRRWCRTRTMRQRTLPRRASRR
jgi:obg-like ATPase 1